MTLLAESAGRLLERTSNRVPRGMTVHDRTRLIGQLHLFLNTKHALQLNQLHWFSCSAYSIKFCIIFLLQFLFPLFPSMFHEVVNYLQLEPYPIYLYSVSIYKEVSSSFSLSLCHINKNSIFSLDLNIFFNYSGHKWEKVGKIMGRTWINGPEFS